MNGNKPKQGEPHHGFIPSDAEDLLRRRVKSELRKRMRGLRAAMPQSAVTERSSRIIEALLAVAPVSRAKSIALFWPIEEKREIDLRPLDLASRDRGMTVYYPAIDPDTRVMTFRRTSQTSDLEERGFGFAEPPPREPNATRGDIDIVIVPALAIDPNGQRIGYGAGYYDRALPEVAPPAITIGVAFDFQLISEVAITPGDFPLNWVVTDARVLKVPDASKLPL